MSRLAPYIIGYGREASSTYVANWQARHKRAVRDAFEQGLASITAGERKEAIFWLGRAERLAGREAAITYSYARALMEVGAYRQAFPRLHELWQRYGTPEVGLALVGGLYACGHEGEAARLMGDVLACNHIGPEAYEMAEILACAQGFAGWATVSNQGTLYVCGAGSVQVTLDGAILGCFVDGVCDVAAASQAKGLAWKDAEFLGVTRAGQHVLGSPFNLQAIMRCQSLIVPEATGVRGWLWYPGEADFCPIVRLSGHETPLIVDGPAEGVTSCELLQRPKGFYLPYEAWPKLERETTSFTEIHGRALMGSPLHPDLVALVQSPQRAVSIKQNWTKNGFYKPVVKEAPLKKGKAIGCAIIVPVHRDKDMVQLCLESVLKTMPSGSLLIIIDDASPEHALRHYVETLAQNKHVILQRHSCNQGFAESINTGLKYVPVEWDVVLLNSDTCVFGNWIQRLQGWLGRKGVGTATPFANVGGLTSYPSSEFENTMSIDDAAALDGLCQRQCEGEMQKPLTTMPTANGFCMAISAACLAAVGRLRSQFFAQGYGEENDFCLRASAKGFSHVAAVNLFVFHQGHGSFAKQAPPLLHRNLTILNRLYPGYDAAIQRWRHDTPLHPIRRLLDQTRLEDKRRHFEGAVLLLQHRAGGGVARAVRERARDLEQQNIMPLVLEPTRRGCRIVTPVCNVQVPNLSFDLPKEYALLIALLKKLGVEWVEWHHLLGHEHGLRHLHQQLGVAYDIYIHDHIWFCPRIVLLDEQGRYCGEPGIAGCEACIATGKLALEEGRNLPLLLARSTEEFAQARRHIAPTRDAARRLERHITGAWSVEVVPLEDDYAIRAGATPHPARRKPGQKQPLRILILGGISQWKGYDVVLALGRYIQRESLPLELILLGNTLDDEAYLRAGIHVMGPYRDEDVSGMLPDIKADIGFVPSIAPETWCYTLSWLWKAKLAVVGFDIGASAERIKEAGPKWGYVLPLAMPINRLAAFFMELWGG